MEIKMFVAFVLATALMIALPGPSVLLAVAHSISFGWRRALVTVFGATLGIAVQLLIAVIGVGSLISLVAGAFDLLRWVGSAYLIYIGIKVWVNAPDMAAMNQAAGATHSRLLMQGLVVTLFNPKSLLFIVAFLPQFLDPARSVQTQFLIIVPAFLAITFAVTAAWAVLSGNLSRQMRDPGKLAVVFRATAVLIIITGGVMAA